MAKQIANSDEFNNLLMDSVDKVLSSLGEKPKLAVYLYLERVSNIPKSEIPAKVDEFSDAILDIFGIGARFLEISIIQNFHLEVGALREIEALNSRDLQGLTLEQYLSFVKKDFEEVRQCEETEE